MLDTLLAKGFEVLALHHAQAILTHDMPAALTELEAILGPINLPVKEVILGGGGEGQLTQRLRRSLTDLGWHKHHFEIKKIVDGREKESISHEIDHVKDFGSGIFALEIEWNNKDPFFDRDLENFKRLHADGVISIGAIITRGASLQGALQTAVRDFARQEQITDMAMLKRYYRPTERQAVKIGHAVARAGSFADGWAQAFVADKFGEATTHWRKLEARVHRGVGNPCPLLLIGIPDTVLTFDS